MPRRTILITGSTDGLGKRVAFDLARNGNSVVLHGRDPKKGGAVLDELRTSVPGVEASYFNADFARMEDVHRMAEAVRTALDGFDVLINNAGIGFGRPGSGRELSADGLELRFQVNYLAGFLLALELMPCLTDRRERKDVARIVHVASAAQEAIDFEDVMLERGYSGYRAYAQSKLAQIMFTMELAERMGGAALTVNALHPATYMDTNMVHEADITPTNSVQKGADAVERLVLAEDLESTTGRYFTGRTATQARGPAYDADARRRLWKLSRELTGATPDL